MKKIIIKITVGILIVVASVFSLGTYLWANNGIVNLESPRFFKKIESSLAVFFDNNIYLFDTSYNIIQTIDLDSISIHSHGDFDFFSNCDLLVYHKEYEESFIENLLTYFRAKKTNQSTPVGSDGFYRCRVLQNYCERIGRELPAINSSFRVSIDKRTNEIYLTDTARFKLYKLDEFGNAIESYENQLKFPNEVFLDNDQVVIANTNFHEVQIRSMDKLSQVESKHETDYDNGYRWPAHLAKVGDNWWVVVADNAMRDGRVFQFTNNWSEIGELFLEGMTDPGDLIYFNERVFVVGWTNFDIGIFDKNGVKQDSLLDVEFLHLLKHQKLRAEKLSSTKTIGLSIFILVLIIGFILAHLLERKKQS